MSFEELPENEELNIPFSESFQPRSLLLPNFSAYCITFGTKQWKLDDSDLIKRLRSHLYGIKHQGKKLFHLIQKIHSENLILIPRRGVTQPLRHQNSQGNNSVQRFVLIVYKPFEDSTRRQSVRRLAWRTPIIRLKPGLLLAPQIRASRYQKYQSVLLRPSEFVRGLNERNRTVWYAPRLEPFNSESLTKIQMAFQRTFENRTKWIISACREIYQTGKKLPQEINWRSNAEKHLKTIRRHLILLRWQGRFLKEELNIDLQKIVSRAALEISRVKKQLEVCDIA